MSQIFTQRAREIIQSIPAGRVSTYGRVALLAGNPTGARQVSWILHSSSEKYDLPWHRVVNREGRISLDIDQGYELQKQLLITEGVIFDEHDRIDLRRFLWIPEEVFYRNNK